MTDRLQCAINVLLEKLPAALLPPVVELLAALNTEAQIPHRPLDSALCSFTLARLIQLPEEK